MPKIKMPVLIEDPNPLVPDPRPDFTPTGFNALDKTHPNAKASQDADRGTIFDLTQDINQRIKIGQDDDVFIFGVSDELSSINANVDLGKGNDEVWLIHSVSDYAFSLSPNDKGITIKYIGDNGYVDGAEITFTGAELFVFRNIADDGTRAGQPGYNSANSEFDSLELSHLIESATSEYLV